MKIRLSLCLIIAALCLSSCRLVALSQPGTATPAPTWTATPRPTLTSTATSTSLPPTQTPAQPTVPSAAATIPTVNILSHQPSFPSFGVVELWLEFAVEPGQTIAGSEIAIYLSDGALEVEFPDGEKRDYPQVPSPTTLVGMEEARFDNLGLSPAGPQIRIALGELLNASAKGQYKVVWHSTDLRSKTMILDWSGETVITGGP